MEPRLDAAGLHRTGAGGRPVRHGRGQGLREGAAPSDHPPVLPGRWRGFPPGPAAARLRRRRADFRRGPNAGDRGRLRPRRGRLEPARGAAHVRRGASPRCLLDRERYHLTGPGGEMVRARDGLLFPNENRGAVELLLVPYDGGEPRVLIDGARQALSAASAGDTVVATVTDPSSWGDLLVRVGNGPERRLTDWSGTFASTVDIRLLEEITATAPDGYD